MDRATEIRGKIFEALNGLEYNGIRIPVFDEFVNPNVTLPSVEGALSAYVVIQDQQEMMSPIQTVCNPRFELDVTIRVVTTWGTVGSKKLCEDIGNEIMYKLKDDRGSSKITGIDKVTLVSARSLAESTSSNLAFSKIIILKFEKNGN